MQPPQQPPSQPYPQQPPSQPYPQQPPSQPYPQPYPPSQPYPPQLYPQQPYPPQGFPPQGFLQQPPQPPRKKNSVLMWVGIGVGAVLLLCCGVSAIALSSNHNGTTTTTSGQTATATPGKSTGAAPTSTPKPTNQIAKAGDTITVNGVSTTFVYMKTLAPDEFDTPKAGNEFIYVHLKIANKTGSEFGFDSFDYHIKSGSGNITDEELFPPSSYTANDTLDSGTLANNGTVEGDIVFQAPIGDHQAELTWQPSFFDNADAVAWSLGL